MAAETTGRYRLLQSDLDAAYEDGHARGERDCLDAKRTSTPHYSSAPIAFAKQLVESFAYRRGIDHNACDLFPMVTRWMDGYRDGYEAEQYADEE